MAEVDRVTVELNAARLVALGMNEEQAQEILDDMGMSKEISDRLMELAAKRANGEDLSWDYICAEINRIGEKYGHQYGVPIPSTADINRELILANKVPLRHTWAANRARTEAEEELTRQNVVVRNSWEVLGDQTVSIIETTEGPMALPSAHYGSRLRKLIDGMSIRAGSQQTAAAEFKAMESLKSRIKEAQWECYVLNGCFPERSPRSDVTYIFRKGYPTLVLSWHGSESGRMIAALCMHPMGYYSNTHIGLMTPTDEVIAHLLMMRSDERRYWSKCGQWDAYDSRSGL